MHLGLSNYASPDKNKTLDSRKMSANGHGIMCYKMYDTYVFFAKMVEKWL